VQEPTRSLLNVSMLVGALRRALKLLASVAPASWLGKTFIAARDGQCYVGARSGNGAVSMMTLIPGASVRSEGLHCFPWDRLGQLAKVVDDRDHVELADGDGIIPSVSAPVLRVESYQRNGIVFKGNMVSASAEGITLPEPTGLDNWSVDAESLVKSLDSAKVAMGENGRQTLDGVLIKADGDGVRVMASDRSQLSHTVLHAFDEGPHGEAFIPSESVKALRVVAVAAGLGNVRFRFEATSIEKPLADGGKTVERFITLSVRTQDVILEIRCDPSHAFPTSRVVGVLTTKTEGLTEFSDVPALTRAVGAACKMIELDANGLKPLTLRSEGRDGHFIVESSAGSVRIGGAENTGPAWSRQFDADILLPYLKSIGKAFPLILENGATSSDPVRFSGAVGVHWICGMADPKPRVAKADPKPSVSVKVAAMGPAESAEVKAVKPKRTARVKADPIAPIIAHVLFTMHRLDTHGNLGTAVRFFLADVHESDELVKSLLATFKQYLPKGKRGESQEDKVERFIRLCVSGSPVSFPLPYVVPPDVVVEDTTFSYLKPWDRVLLRDGRVVTVAGKDVPFNPTVCTLHYRADDGSTGSIEMGWYAPVKRVASEPTAAIRQTPPWESLPSPVAGPTQEPLPTLPGPPPVETIDPAPGLSSEGPGALPGVIEAPTVDVTVADLAETAFRFRKAHPFGSFPTDVVPPEVDRVAKGLRTILADKLPATCFELHPYPWYSAYTVCKMVQEQVKGTSFYIASVAVQDHFPMLFAQDPVSQLSDIVADELIGGPIGVSDIRQAIDDATRDETVRVRHRTARIFLLSVIGDIRWGIDDAGLKEWNRADNATRDLIVAYLDHLEVGPCPYRGVDAHGRYDHFLFECVTGVPIFPKPGGPTNGSIGSDREDASSSGQESGGVEVDPEGRIRGSNRGVLGEDQGGPPCRDERQGMTVPPYRVERFPGGFQLIPITPEPEGHDDDLPGLQRPETNHGAPQLGRSTPHMGKDALRDMPGERRDQRGALATDRGGDETEGGPPRPRLDAPGRSQEARHLAGDALPDGERLQIDLTTIVILFVPLGIPFEQFDTASVPSIFPNATKMVYTPADLSQPEASTPFPSFPRSDDEDRDHPDEPLPLRRAVRRHAIRALRDLGRHDRESPLARDGGRTDATLAGPLCGTLAAPEGVRRDGTSPRASLTLEIDGRPYGVARTPDGWDLAKGDGASYRVTLEPSGPSCECPDFEHRHRGLPTQGCRHIRSLRAVGLIPASIFLEVIQ
jgi:hypothetical protein